MTLSMTTQRRAVKGIGNGILLLMLLWTAIPFYQSGVSRQALPGWGRGTLLELAAASSGSYKSSA
jgi:hypothetical protein